MINEILKECNNIYTEKTKNYFINIILKYTKEYKLKYLFELYKKELQSLCARVVKKYAKKI